MLSRPEEQQKLISSYNMVTKETYDLKSLLNRRFDTEYIYNAKFYDSIFKDFDSFLLDDNLKSI